MMNRWSAAACAALVLVSGTGLAQQYPARSIRLVVPWPAGGPPDAMGRVIGQRAGAGLRQQVLVDNRPGANSIIGTEIVAKSAPDGYTYLLTTGSRTTNAALYTKLPYDTLRDFAALALVAETKDVPICGNCGFKDEKLFEKCPSCKSPYIIS